jgi:hypothetical protein
MMKWSFPLLALGLLAAPSTAQEKTDPTIEAGRQFTQWFFAGEDEKLWEKFGPAMKQGMGGSAANLAGFRAQVEAQLGTEVEVTEETTTEAQGYKVYLRTSKYSKYAQPILTQWAIAADGTIGGFFIRPG